MSAAIARAVPPRLRKMEPVESEPIDVDEAVEACAAEEAPVPPNHLWGGLDCCDCSCCCSRSACLIASGTGHTFTWSVSVPS